MSDGHFPLLMQRSFSKKRYSYRPMFKGSQSRKFSYRVAATQRDTSSVVCKSTFIGNMKVTKGRVRGAFCPALNILGTDTMR